MVSAQKKAFRAAALFSVALLSQCCCCIIPLQLQAGPASPVLSQWIGSLNGLLLTYPWAVGLFTSLLGRPVGAFFLP
jgi:hypothetical protein